ncbi:MAG TPA: hypothetical protein VNX28_17620 [Gemmataceae bacterium]|jgi:hypothetical protein|nr:hypothetical protein [Gemmataceae bacterium]
MAATDKLFAGKIPEIYDRFLVPLIFESYAGDLAERVVLFVGIAMPPLDYCSRRPRIAPLPRPSTGAVVSDRLAGAFRVGDN